MGSQMNDGIVTLLPFLRQVGNSKVAIEEGGSAPESLNDT